MPNLLVLSSALLLAGPALAQTTAPPLVASALAVGETAPAFKGQDAAGRPVELRHGRQGAGPGDEGEGDDREPDHPPGDERRHLRPR